MEADVEGLGKMGQIVEVKVAYATNVIVAKGLGSVASKEMVAQIAKSEAEAVIASAEEKKKVAKASADSSILKCMPHDDGSNCRMCGRSPDDNGESWGWRSSTPC